MSVLKRSINTRSEDFKANAEAMQKQVDDLKEVISTVKQGGGFTANERHVRRGKLLARERIRRLLDVGSPFLELSQLAGWNLYPEDGVVAAGGIITGIGRIEGQECMVVANDPTVKGGSYYPITVKKTPACPGNRHAEPSAMCVSGREWRSEPATSGRSIPG